MASPDSRFQDAGVMVTGAQGFIGSWLAERLVSLGARVVAPCRDLHPATRFHREGVAQRCRLEWADVRDYDAMLRVLSEHGVSTVFHLAAQPIVGTANRAPLSTYESNIRGTYTLLEACRERALAGEPVERIVVASSDHAYGSMTGAPAEDQPLAPSYPYDVSKACADMVARGWAESYGMPVAVTRLANVYGGGDRNWSRIVPDSARALVRGERPVIRSDGSPQREYLYVEDAVDAYLAVARSLDEPASWGRAWNAGMGESVSVLHLVQRLIAASGRRLEPEIRGRGTPPAEAARLALDSTAIRDELGWTPRWTLDEGLARTFEWYERALTQPEPAGAGALS